MKLNYEDFILTSIMFEQVITLFIVVLLVYHLIKMQINQVNNDD